MDYNIEACRDPFPNAIKPPVPERSSELVEEPAEGLRYKPRFLSAVLSLSKGQPKDYQNAFTILLICCMIELSTRVGKK